MTTSPPSTASDREDRIQQSNTYTVIGLVDLVAGNFDPVLVAGVTESGIEVLDEEEFSGPDDRYQRFCFQVQADTAEEAESECRAQINAILESEDDEGGIRYWDLSDQQIYSEAVYSRLSANARAIFAVLASQPGRRFTGQQLAAAAGLKNLHGVAGSLSRPRVLCTEANRIQCWWFTDPSAGRTEYWFEDIHAVLFLEAAKAAAQG